MRWCVEVVREVDGRWVQVDPRTVEERDLLSTLFAEVADPRAPLLAITVSRDITEEEEVA